MVTPRTDGLIPNHRERPALPNDRFFQCIAYFSDGSATVV